MLFPRIQGAQKQVPETNGAGAATAGPVSAEADDDWFADETRKVLWHEYMSSAQVVKALPLRCHCGTATAANRKGHDKGARLASRPALP